MSTQDWILVSVVFYCTVLGTVALYAFWIKRASVLEPIGQFLIFVSLFALPLPIRAWITVAIEGNVTPHLPSLIQYLPYALTLTACALVAFTAAYYSPLASSAGARLSSLVPDCVEYRPLLAFFLLGGFSLFLVFSLSQDVGGFLNFVLLGYGSSEQAFEQGYLAIGIPWFFVSTFFLLRHALSRRSLSWALAYAAVIVLYVTFLAALGNRGMIMYVAISVVVYFHVAVRKLSIKTVAATTLVAFLALNMLGITRSSLYESVSDAIDRTVASASSATDLSAKEFFYTLSIGEFVVPFETFPQIVRATSTGLDFEFGESFLRTPLFIVPRVLYPDRPAPLSSWYMDEFYGSHGISEGRAFFFLSEGYLNFGPAGVLGLAALWGILWGAVRACGHGESRTHATALLYALTVAFLFRCVRGDFSTLTVGLLQQSLSAAILGLFIACFAIKRRVSNRE